MGCVRVVPCLDVNNGRVVKGVGFQNLKEKGDPLLFARMYEAQGADELVFLDVGATVESRKMTLKVLEEVSSEIFIPLTAGGGIASEEDMRSVLRAGADKVSLCSAALRDPELIRRGAAVFGSQCIVISIDARRVGERWHACTHGGQRDTGIDAIDWGKRCRELGAGEILLNSIDRDGTQAGYDLELIRAMSEAVDIPVIASGGAGTREQLLEGVTRGKADAVLLASLLHDGKLTVKMIKDFFRKKGVDVPC
ncbi:MAG TPA: imidazole glycerol phosphate synthase subunit HisF [Candidatus Mcinerneyibacteriales bacterium]|nr:imidazole glycerol phosphate synthase subunit HisF [Candidatus Mcinerneyibacteriales bacterium]